MLKYLIAVLFPITAYAQVNVIKVTNLNDSGTGSLRKCVEASGKRACIFEIGGRIKQNTPLRIVNNDVSIYGETAPESVVISGASVQVEASNVQLSHLEVRAGDLPVNQNDGERDSVKIVGTTSKPVRNVYLKNLSISWGKDENLSTYGPVSDVRVEDCIISEGLRFSNHPEQGTKGHSMGVLVGVGTSNAHFVRNLLVSNHDRNIRWRENSSGSVINNVIYNWGGTTSWNVNNVTNSASGAITLDFAGNHYIAGPASGAKTFILFAENLKTPSGSRFYVQDNIGPMSGAVENDWGKITNLPTSFKSSTRKYPAIAIEAPSGLLERTMQGAGAMPWARNHVDRRLLQEVRDGSVRIIDCVESCGYSTPSGQAPVRAESGYGFREGKTKPLSIAEGLIADADFSVWLQSVGTDVLPEPSASPTPSSTNTPTPIPTRAPRPSPTPTPSATLVRNSDGSVEVRVGSRQEILITESRLTVRGKRITTDSRAVKTLRDELKFTR